ncbi:MAG: cadherin-like beta sandwich domain-containing protein [Bryobacterales bacterium]|nr:cadherin-like beta sandwich domain-containing protein [Bryobacterales bacterium]
MKRLLLLLTILLCAGSCAIMQRGPATLAGLELGADKTDIERLSIPLNERFSPSTLKYTAAVEASYTNFLFVTPKLSSNQGVSLKINGADARPGEASKVPLSLGGNKIGIEVASSGGETRTYELTVTRADRSREYWSEPIGKGMWRIQDFGGHVGNEDMYLIEGSGRALLFDTGMGKGDLAAYVRTLTKLPVDVAITHGHRDHFLQVDQFPDATVYMSELDVTRMPPELVTPKYKWIKDGDVIDIGAGRKYEVIPVPGHSLGSVLYVDFANQVAITGDAVSSGSMVYMFAPTCTALDQYLDGLRKLEERIKGLDGLTLLTGHHYQERTPLRGAAGKQLITDMRIAAEKVLRGELEGKPAQTVRDGRATELRQANVGLAGLWYNPKNLVTDPAALGFLKVRTAAAREVIPRPVFSSFLTEYAAAVPRDVAKVTITPTAYWPDHKGITVNGKPVKSGEAVNTDIAMGANRIDVAVTSGKGTVRTYTVILTRGGGAK